MGNFKRIALIFLLFGVIMVIISVFLPSSFHMERKVVINADKEQIFNQVNDLKNWKNWAPWVLKDEAIYNTEESYSNPSYGVGATFNWDSKNDDVGKGDMEIVISKPNTYIKISTNFGFIESIGEWDFNDVEDGVEAIWSMDVEFGFNPVSKFFGLFLEKQVSPDYELGLERLKIFTENLPKINKVVVKKEMMEKDLWFLSIRDTVNQKEMNNVHGKIYEEINNYMYEHQIAVDASPMVIYHNWSEVIDIEVGIPISDSIIIKSNSIKLNKIKSTYVVTAIHYGPYDRLPETYFGINEWMRKNKVVVTGPPWESYLTDPTTEPNPDKWLTAIYFPIE